MVVGLQISLTLISTHKSQMFKLLPSEQLHVVATVLIQVGLLHITYRVFYL